MSILRWSTLLFLAVIAACVTRPPPPISDSATVRALADSARLDVEAGRLPNAAATLERALRIEPRNARLWHELARVRFGQGDHAQAEALAARSNSYAGADRDLRSLNWQLIADARREKGDERGAAEALQRATP